MLKIELLLKGLINLNSSRNAQGYKDLDWPQFTRNINLKFIVERKTDTAVVNTWIYDSYVLSDTINLYGDEDEFLIALSWMNEINLTKIETRLIIWRLKK